MKSALLAGSTGLIGRFCLNILLKNNVYDKIIIPVRKKTENENEKLYQLIINYDKISDFKNEMKADDIFCCLGTTMKKAGSKEEFYKVDFNYVYNLAKLCKDNGAKTFSLISSIGADKNSGNFYLKVKGETEDAVIKLGYDTTNIFRPSVLAGERYESRPGEKAGIILMKLIAPLLQGPLKKYRAIDAETVAEVMVKAAQYKNNHVNIFPSDMINKIYTENIC
jgi:nucleoside-diphosphate-sugar epimerase